MSGNPSPSDHDNVIRILANQENMARDINSILEKMASKESVSRAHDRIDKLTKYLLAVAAAAAAEAFAIIRILLLDRG